MSGLFSSKKHYLFYILLVHHHTCVILQIVYLLPDRCAVQWRDAWQGPYSKVCLGHPMAVSASATHSAVPPLPWHLTPTNNYSFCFVAEFYSCVMIHLFMHLLFNLSPRLSILLENIIVQFFFIKEENYFTVICTYVTAILCFFLAIRFKRLFNNCTYPQVR